MRIFEQIHAIWHQNIKEIHVPDFEVRIVLISKSIEIILTLTVIYSHSQKISI